MGPHEYTYNDTSPEIHEDAAVSAESTVAGDVTVAADVTVWPGAVLRGDVGPMRLGEGSAVGDNAVLHGTTGQLPHPTSLTLTGSLVEGGACP